MGNVNHGVLGERWLSSSTLCKGVVAEQDSSTYFVARNKKAPLHARKSTYTNSIWTYVWRMDRTGAKVTNVSRGFVLSPPGGDSNPRPLFRRALSLPQGQGSRGTESQFVVLGEFIIFHHAHFGGGLACRLNSTSLGTDTRCINALLPYCLTAILPYCLTDWRINLGWTG
jgi:hypothetical protein